MRFHPTNRWFHSSEFLRAAHALHAARGTANFMTANRWDCKYIQLYVDQRTGDFIFRTGDGNMLPHDQVYDLFPTLADKDDVTG